MENLPDQPIPSDRVRLIQQAVRSVKWSGLANLLPQIISPVSTLVLASILTPSDFGVVAVSALVISLSQILVGLGLGPAVIQRRTLVAEAASVAFWLNTVLAVVFYVLLWLAAPWLAQTYQNQQLIQVIRVAGISLLLFALGSVPLALLQRDLKFRSIFWANTVLEIVSVSSSILLAVLGAGVWALILGPLLGAVARTIIVWIASRWYPLFSIQWSVVTPLLSFGAWILISSFITWLFQQGDNAIAGYFMGEKVLGIYNLGFTISYLLPGLIISPLSAVAYPAFCALQGDRKEVGRSLLQIQSLAAAILLPMSLGISVIANPTVSLLYGEKWQGLGSVIQMLSIVVALSTLWSLYADAYRSLGRPDIWVKISAATLLILIPLLVATARYGLVVFTLARSCGNLIYVFLNIVFGGMVLGITAKDQLRGLLVPFCCSGIMYSVAYILIRVLTPFTGMVGWLKLLAIILMSAFLYLSSLWGMDRRLWNRMIRAGIQVLSERLRKKEKEESRSSGIIQP